jgi:hypothetical protein
MDDACRSARHRALKSGSIRFGDVAIPCIIRNQSTAGVALDVGPHARIPDQFTLIVHAENKIYPCTVIWRKEKRLGVAFYWPAEAKSRRRDETVAAFDTHTLRSRSQAE